MKSQERSTRNDLILCLTFSKVIVLRDGLPNGITKGVGIL